MIARDPEILDNLLDIIAPDGEDGVRIVNDGRRATVDLEYLRPEDGEMARCCVRFSGVKAIHTTLIPGPDLLDVQIDGSVQLMTVLRFGYSEAASAWDGLAQSKRPIFHYMMYLIGSKMRIDIFAKSYDGITASECAPAVANP